MIEEQILDEDLNPQAIDSSVSMDWQAVQWWERRRLKYNLFQLGLGAIALIIAYTFLGGSPEMLFLILPYAFFANVAYCLGWFTHLILLRLFPSRLTKNVLLVLWWMGVAFSAIGTVGFPLTEF